MGFAEIVGALRKRGLQHSEISGLTIPQILFEFGIDPDGPSLDDAIEAQARDRRVFAFDAIRRAAARLGLFPWELLQLGDEPLARAICDASGAPANPFDARRQICLFLNREGQAD